MSAGSKVAERGSARRICGKCVGRKIATGFTLIEMLVVLAIVSVMVVAVGLSVDAGGPSRQVATEARRFIALMGLACDESARSGEEIGARLDAGGYRFVRAIGRQWELSTGDALRSRRLPQGMRIALRIGDREIDLDASAPATTAGPDDRPADEAASESTPQLACDSEGTLTSEPELVFSAGNARSHVVLDEDGELRESSQAPPA